MTSQRLLAGSGWSLLWALPGAVRDEADGVQGGCREEISKLPVVSATTGLFGKEQTFKAERVSTDRSRRRKWSDQEDDPAAVKENLNIW